MLEAYKNIEKVVEELKKTPIQVPKRVFSSPNKGRS